MTEQQPTRDYVSRAEFEALRAQVTALRAGLTAVVGRTQDTDLRARDSEHIAHGERLRVDALEHRADDVNHRADASDARATKHSARMDNLEARIDVDREVMAQLQADGLVGDEHAAHLRHAMHTSRRIGAAMGIVMAARAVNEEEAFELLSRASQRSNRRLRLIAEEIVVKGHLGSLLLEL